MNGRYYVSQVLVRVSPLKQLSAKFLKGIEEAVQIHEAVFTSLNHVLVYYVVVRPQHRVRSQTLTSRKFLELRASNEIIIFGTCQFLKDFLCLRINIEQS